jgi:menaquinol-cytochrome c reductase iron-sulfur subunit
MNDPTMKSMDVPSQRNRRGFFLSVIYGLWALIGTALAAPALIYLLFPPRLRSGDDWVEAGDVSKLVPNLPVEMIFRRNHRDGWKFSSEQQTAWVIKLGNEVVAYGPQCTHLGCAYHWEASKTEFLCPCHTSVFGPDGKVVSGPAPRPLDRYESRVENGKLMVRSLREMEDSPA